MLQLFNPFLGNSLQGLGCHVKPEPLHELASRQLPSHATLTFTPKGMHFLFTAVHTMHQMGERGFLCFDAKAQQLQLWLHDAKHLCRCDVRLGSQYFVSSHSGKFTQRLFQVRMHGFYKFLKACKSDCTVMMTIRGSSVSMVSERKTGNVETCVLETSVVNDHHSPQANKQEESDYEHWTRWDVSLKHFCRSALAMAIGSPFVRVRLHEGQQVSFDTLFNEGHMSCCTQPANLKTVVANLCFIYLIKWFKLGCDFFTLNLLTMRTYVHPQTGTMLMSVPVSDGHILFTLKAMVPSVPPPDIRLPRNSQAELKATPFAWCIPQTEVPLNSFHYM